MRGWTKRWFLGALVFVVFSGLWGVSAMTAQEGGAQVSADSGLAGVEELVIWSWRGDTAARIEGVTPMVWAEINYRHRPKRRGTNYHTARPDHEIAAEVIPALLAQPVGRRALFLWYVGSAEGVMGSQSEPPLFPEGRAAEALARGGLRGHTEAHTRRLMQRLNLAEAVPDFVVLDYEGGAGRWQLGRRGGKSDPVTFRADVEAVWDQAASAMPPELAVMGAEGFLKSGSGVPGREETMMFNAWAGQQRRRALRGAVVNPVWESLGARVPVSNYNESVRAWAVPDLNGWPQPAASRISGSWSSPSTYLGVEGNRYKKKMARRTVLERAAVAWVDQRNEVRSALAWSPDVAPWTSHPSYRRPEEIEASAWRWHWAAGVMHDRALGVNRMLLWSSRPWSEDDIAFAQRVFEVLHRMPAERPAEISALSDDPAEAEAELERWVERAKELVGETP